MDIEINDYEILDRANQFRDAADILKQSNKLIPTELNACLACELYLKYLVNFEKDGIQTKTKKQLVAGHDLKELYDKCDDSIKILKSRTTSPAGGLLLTLRGRCYFSA